MRGLADGRDGVRAPLGRLALDRARRLCAAQTIEHQVSHARRMAQAPPGHYQYRLQQPHKIRRAHHLLARRNPISLRHAISAAVIERMCQWNCGVYSCELNGTCNLSARFICSIDLRSGLSSTGTPLSTTSLQHGSML